MTADDIRPTKLGCTDFKSALNSEELNTQTFVFAYT